MIYLSQICHAKNCQTVAGSGIDLNRACTEVVLSISNDAFPPLGAYLVWVLLQFDFRNVLPWNNNETDQSTRHVDFDLGRVRFGCCRGTFCSYLDSRGTWEAILVSVGEDDIAILRYVVTLVFARHKLTDMTRKTASTEETNCIAAFENPDEHPPIGCVHT
jgi:hypothetical protein